MKNCDHNKHSTRCFECDFIQSQKELISALEKVSQLLEKLSEANAEIERLERHKFAKFVKFCKEHKSVDGVTALQIHALGVAFAKENIDLVRERKL